MDRSAHLAALTKLVAQRPVTALASMRVALDDLKLRRQYVVHAGRHNFDIDRKVRCIAASSLLDELG